MRPSSFSKKISLSLRGRQQFGMVEYQMRAFGAADEAPTHPAPISSVDEVDPGTGGVHYDFWS